MREQSEMKKGPAGSGSRPLLSYLAGGEGVEPPFMESESIVLPLNDPPEMCPGVYM